ncbi:MAG TPA: hypothetical protein VIP51_01355 [Eoetvoesiella sp.]
MKAVIPDLAKVARSYGQFRAVAGVGAIRNEADYDRALTLIEAILDETRDTPARGGQPKRDFRDSGRPQAAQHTPNYRPGRALPG